MNLRSLLVSAIIAVTVIGGALLLKSNRAAPTSRIQPTEVIAEPAAAARALPRFVDVGTTTCAPCRVMLGVMTELEQRYPGQMIVEFVNSSEQPSEAGRYNVQMIPTQIFFAPDGRELYRHEGVLRAAEVVAKWEQLGFRLNAPAQR